MRRLRSLSRPVNRPNRVVDGGACRSMCASSQRPRPRPPWSGATISRPISQSSPTRSPRTPPISRPPRRRVHTSISPTQCVTSSRDSCNAGMASVPLEIASPAQQHRCRTRISGTSAASARSRTAPGTGGSCTSVTARPYFLKTECSCLTTQVNPTRLFVLGVLARQGPMHGHQIRRDARVDRTELWSEVRPGSLYSALHKLHDEGLIEEVPREQPGNLPARTVYAITEEGRRELRALRAEAVREDGGRPEPLPHAL